MSAIWMWFRVEWRSRWKALLGLALLVAFTTASIQATVAGARRGATSVDRLLDVTEPATLAVTLNQGAFDWDVVRAMPQVESVSAFAVSEYAVEGLPEGVQGADEIAGFPFVDDEVWTTIERPVVLTGRLPDSSRADEVAVSSNFVDHFGLGVGDPVTLRLYTPEQLDSMDEGEPAGQAVGATIVGVIRSPWFSDQPGNPAGGLAPSPGLYAEFPDNIVGTSGAVNVNAMLRLRDGGAGIDDFEREFTRVTGIENFDTIDLHAAAQHDRDVTRFEARALLLLGLTALLATVVLVGVAISRFAAASFSDLDVLRAFGLPPGRTRTAMSVAPASAALVGVLLAFAVAWWSSRIFPIGSAAFVEPSPGPDFDPLVLLLPVLVVPPLVATATAVTLRRRAASFERSSSSPSAVDSVTSTWPLTLGLGTRFALSGRSTRNSSSARPALIGIILGVTGVVAALTFAQGISDATDGYERFGQTYELGAFFGAGGQDFVDATTTLVTISEDPGVDGVLDVRNDVASSDQGPVSLFTHTPVGDPIDTVVTEGRLPSTGSEIAIGPETAEKAGLSVGDTIELTGTRGSIAMTVTGTAFVPQGPHNGYASGGWVLADAFDELFDGFRFHFALVSTAPGSDPAVVTERLAESDGIELFPGPIIPPDELGELEELGTVPLLLAGFLAVLAVGAVAHTLASTARRRRHDMAMLRALGLRPRGSVAIVFVQAAVIAAVGLAIGLPLGVVLGRGIWRTVALDTPVEFVEPYSWPIAAMTILAVAVLTALLALWPSRRLASMRLGAELRSE